MILIEGLTKKFGNVTAVDNLNLNIKEGEIFGFLGPNGAGKTTTIRILAGILKPTDGKVIVGQYDIEKEPLLAKQIISYIPDQPFIYPKLTGEEFLKFISDIYGIPRETQKDKITEVLKLFELTNHTNELVESYSYGMQRKLLFASILMRKSNVILLDEPLVGLDPKMAKMVKMSISKLSSEGATVFMSTHTLEIAEKLCHRIGIILNGRIITIGTKEELETKAKMTGSLEEIFLSLTGGDEALLAEEL